MLGTVLLIVLVVLLIGGFFPGPMVGPGPAPLYPGYGFRSGTLGIVGTLLVIVLILYVLGIV
jgi:hypothetical protein